jgi:hypothetical protein
MFVKGKKELLETMVLLQRNHCSYDFYRIDHESKPPIMCDCKYGFVGKTNGEQTGCPELRCVVELLKAMTDEEYGNILSRLNHFGI